MQQVFNQTDNILKEIDLRKDLLAQLVKITKIPSPTGHEEQKILFIKSKLQKYGYKNVLIDKAGNCILKLPSKLDPKKKTILIVAHTDTACNPGKKVTITEDKKFIYGHGVCDNSAGVLSLLTSIYLINKYAIKFPHNLIFGFTVGEEGLGAKRGMKQIIKDYEKQIDGVINIESHHIGRVTNQAIGQYRSKILVDTKLGGHSFRDFGRPNANVILAQIISIFSSVKLPQSKWKTTFNIGQMAGEGSINSIAKEASCLFEIRSENDQYLKKTKKAFESIIKKSQKKYPKVQIINSVLAETPAVIFSPNHKIYELTIAAQKQLGITPKINAGNTDGDVSLAKNIPTVTIGTSEGWNTHSLEEYMEKKSLSLGIKQAFLVIHEIASNL